MGMEAMAHGAAKTKSRSVSLVAMWGPHRYPDYVHSDRTCPHGHRCLGFRNRCGCS